MQSASHDTTQEHVGARPPRNGLRAVILVLCVGVLFFVAGFLHFVGSMSIAETPPARNAEGIVVLTGAASRISDALTLLSEGRGKRLLISGVNPATRAQEISRLMPEHQRWFSCCVDLGRSAVNTIGNAVEARRWANAQGFKSLIVVTSNFHMPRAMTELERQLPGVALVPYPVISEKVRVESWWTSPSTAKLLFWEYLKYLAALVRQWAGL
jgi:uncharacterized SAM-binding protein YcdF (DUF218 family)